MKARDERRVDGTPTGIREARKSEQLASKMAGVHFINVRSGFFLTATLLARDLARALSSAAQSPVPLLLSIITADGLCRLATTTRRSIIDTTTLCVA